MAKHRKERKKKRKDNHVKALKKTKTSDLFEKIELFLSANEKIALFITLLVATVVYLLCFDVKISVGGDDSGYIQKGHRFINEGIFPTSQGPVYPIVLGFFIKLFGIKVPLLKILSVLFTVLHIAFFYKAFKGLVPYLTLIVSCFLVAINSYIAFYASSTYSEVFFMFSLSILFLFFLRYTFKNPENTTVVSFIIIGLIVFITSQIRFVGFAAILAISLFLVLQKQFKNALVAFGSFAGFYALFSLLKKLLGVGNGMSNQLDTLMMVHPYDASKGKETFSGFINRFFDNADLYLSKTFLIELGLRPEGSKIAPFLTLVIGLLFLAGLFIAFKHNKTLLFTGLFIAALAGMTFVILQPFWDQNRLILILYPFFYLFFLSTIYLAFKKYLPSYLQIGFLLSCLILIFLSFSRTGPKIQENVLILQKNINKNPLYGYTTDWINYINMVQWASENLPETSKVACRKPSIAFIYSNGTAHHGIFRINSQDPDELLAKLRDKNVTHVIRASLRTDPKKNTGRTINTIIRYMSFVERKYPGTFKGVHQVGKKEPAVLYEINYPN